MDFEEARDYYNQLGTSASRFSKLSDSVNVSRKDDRTAPYVLTFQNNEEGNKLCKQFKSKHKPKKGCYYQKQGRHSDRQGLADKGLASREWMGFGRKSRLVRNVKAKHSEYYDLYVRVR